MLSLQNVFVKDARTGKPIEGSVWPGKTYFPDFTSTAGQKYWLSMLRYWYGQVKYDGLWIDMNEPSSFGPGSTTGCDRNQYNNPPLVPLLDGNIIDKTLCMDSLQNWGRHYSVHSLYGYSEAIATRSALLEMFPNQRPFVLSRSTYLGSGAWTFHWTGDDTSSWDQLKFSIITILEFQMFGIPMTGADICGFNGDTTEELCTRWMQLGAFYPFMRNHNAIHQRDQDPAVWSTSAQASMKKALQLRYQLLPSLYTLFYFSSTTGAPVLQPLFYQWPADATAQGIDDQFLWGSGLMVAPVHAQGATSRSVYFPAARWYSFYDGSSMGSTSSGQTATVAADLMSIPLFVRGGTVLPWQAPAITTHAARANPMGLVVALDSSYNADGSLYWDDGVSINAVSTKTYLLLQFKARSSGNGGYLSMLPLVNGYRGADGLKISTVYVMGLRSRPSRVSVGASAVSPSQIAFNGNNMMTLTGLTIPLSTLTGFPQQIKWSY